MFEMQSLIQVLHLITLMIIVFINSPRINAEEDEINQLFCQLNDYAKIRVLNNQNVFPCNQ